MAVHAMHRSCRKDVGPAAGYFESVITDFQETQHTPGEVVDAADQLSEFLEFMQPRF